MNDAPGTIEKPKLELIADNLIETTLHNLRVFAEKAPVTSVGLCFLAGVGAATLLSHTQRL